MYDNFVVVEFNPEISAHNAVADRQRAKMVPRRIREPRWKGRAHDRWLRRHRSAMLHALAALGADTGISYGGNPTSATNLVAELTSIGSTPRLRA